MKKAGKILGIVAGVLVVLIIVLVVAAKVLITPERVRETVVPLAEKNLNRSVAIGDIDISLFSGVVIRDVRVGMQDTDQDFVAADEMVLRYQFWPLLKKQVVVDEIRLEKPQIRVVRNKDGTFNFSDLLTAPPASEPKEESAAPASEDKQGNGINLLVSRLQVKDGTLFFTDHGAGTDGFEYEISGFNASAKDIARDQSFPFEMAARLGQAPFSAKGTVNAAEARIQTEVKLDEFNMVDFSPYLENQARAAIEGLRPVVSGTIDLSSQKIHTEGLEVVLGDDVVSVDLTVTNLFSRPVNIQNRIYASSLNIDALMAAVQTPQSRQEEKNGREKPDSNSTESQKPAPKGKDTPLGPFDLPVAVNNGQVDVDKAVYKGLAMTDLKLGYRLVENVLTVETLEARLAEGAISGNARVDLGVAGLSYDSDFSVQEISADALMSGLYPKAAGTLLGRTSAAINVSGRGTAWEQMRDALSGQGQVRISEGKIAGNDFAGGLARTLGAGDLKSIDFKSFEGDFEIEDGKLRLVSDFAGKDVKMNPTGTIGLDGALDMNLNLALAPGFSSRLSSDSLVGQLLEDEQGWTSMPVALGGSLGKPRFVLDKARLQKQLTEEGSRKVIEKGLQKLFQ
ncbi:MAG: AsmA family protein [Desulfosalsimonas sp.]